MYLDHNKHMFSFAIILFFIFFNLFVTTTGQCCSASGQDEFRLASIFSDHMVLQRWTEEAPNMVASSECLK